MCFALGSGFKVSLSFETWKATAGRWVPTGQEEEVLALPLNGPQGTAIYLCVSGVKVTNIEQRVQGVAGGGRRSSRHSVHDLSLLQFSCYWILFPQAVAFKVAKEYFYSPSFSPYSRLIRSFAC